MKVAFWPGLGGGTQAFAEVEDALRERGVHAFTVDPRYGSRGDWRLPVLASELAGTGADAFAGASWGGAVAVVAAGLRAPSALVLIDGGHTGRRDQPAVDVRAHHETLRWSSTEEFVESMRVASPRWNTVLERAAMTNVVERDGAIVPVFDADTLESIIQSFDDYDPCASLAAVPRSTRMLFVASRDATDEQLERLPTHADVRVLDQPHDIVRGLGPELGALIADWLGEA